MVVVTVYYLEGGQPFAVEVRPDAVVTTRVAVDTGLAEIMFTEGSRIPVTLILPGDVVRQVVGQLIRPVAGQS